AVVVDDYLMKITHAFRGEEWLPSAPVHLLLWKYLFGYEVMPKWAHLPLILGPNGKLSKRDGAKYGFPVYAMNWTDPKSGELTEGFREKGFLPEAFINMLAMLGWNDGTDQELFSMEELIEKFSIERIHNGGARFDYEKAKWFNQEWMKRQSDETLADTLAASLQERNITATPAYILRVVALVKERCVLLPDLWEQSCFFFEVPEKIDLETISGKWNADKRAFFEALIHQFKSIQDWYPGAIEEAFKTLAAEKNIKPGELQLPMRIMLVGGKFGPAVFEIAGIIGITETIARIEAVLKQL
ncbi:MAG: glutamate--tRNA ligase, partial [Chitinophagaceae bacterium]